MNNYLGNYLKNDTITVNKRYTENRNNYSVKSLKWIKYLEEVNNKKIISAFEGLEEELKITSIINNKKQNLKVDGYDVKNKIVYQFQGCYYHGCPKCYKPDDINTENNTLMKDLYPELIIFSFVSNVLLYKSFISVLFSVFISSGL